MYEKLIGADLNVSAQSWDVENMCRKRVVTNLNYNAFVIFEWDWKFPIFKCSQTIIKTVLVFFLAFLVKNLLFLVTVVYWRKIWILHGANLMASNLLYIKYFQICFDLTINFFFYKIKLNFGTKQLWMGI